MQKLSETGSNALKSDKSSVKSQVKSDPTSPDQRSTTTQQSYPNFFHDSKEIINICSSEENVGSDSVGKPNSDQEA